MLAIIGPLHRLSRFLQTVSFFESGGWTTLLTMGWDGPTFILLKE